LGVKYDLGSRTQFFNKLVQRRDPNSTTGASLAKDVNVVDLGGNSVAAIGNANADIAGSALDLIYSTSIGGFALTTFLSALERTELPAHHAQPGLSTPHPRPAAPPV